MSNVSGRKRRRCLSIRASTHAKLKCYLEDPDRPIKVDSISGLMERLIADHLGTKYDAQAETWAEPVRASAAPPEVAVEEPMVVEEAVPVVEPATEISAPVPAEEAFPGAPAVTAEEPVETPTEETPMGEYVPPFLML